MVEKITIKPTKVRGQGNVLEPKTIENYKELNCEIESVEESTVNVNVFKLTPLFFELGFTDNSNNNITEFYSNTQINVEASVRYSNSNVVTSDERLTNQLLGLTLDGQRLVSRYVDSQGYWRQKYNIGRLSPGIHEFYLDFKGIVSQIFKVNVLKSIGSITLTSNKSETYLGENITWTANVKDDDGTPLPEKTVIFFNSSTGEILSTKQTDNNGECTFTHAETGIVSALGYRSINIRATCTDVNSNIITGTYWNHNAQSVSCEIDKTESYVGEPIYLQVTFYDHFNNIVDGTVCIDGANSNEYSIEEKNHKSYITYTPQSKGTKSLKLYLCGFSYNIYTNKEIVVNAYDASLTINTPEWIPYGGSLAIESTLLKDQQPQNENLKLYVNNEFKATINSQGIYDYEGLPKGTNTIKIVLDVPKYEYTEVTKTVYCGATVTIDNVTKN
ncbi:Ig-like domain-containing protein [uncultured Methanobrevibacter sp.]|uniref:Ig-like domain-containing protein n=1 Tax=uncultured Methanobrevibacter sp. TaxID=253161 RepID=UPI0025F860CE|nr:Ig-like domain-containing protein [uncultured Methanobrevibacter sp.]